MTDHGQNGFVEDKAAPSEQVLRSTDSRLVNVDRLAQEIARAMGFARVEFALKVITIANAVFARASRGEIQLYCEDRPFPFDKDENESMHGGLRLTNVDADALRAFYLDSLSDPLAKPNQTPQATAVAQQEVAADRANHGHKSNAEHLGDSAQGQGGSSWTLNKIERSGGYRPALHRLLKAAHLEGKEIPSAREVLEAWRISRPDEIARVLPNGFDYYDAKGNTKCAELKALSQTIGRLTQCR